METKDTAVALLKEWERLKNTWVDEDDYRDDLGEPIEEAKAKIDAAWDHLDTEKASVSRRLDEMAEAAGICMIGDKFGYESEKVLWQAVDGIGYKFLDISAREQQAIQEWLLIKSEK